MTRINMRHTLKLLNKKQKQNKLNERVSKIIHQAPMCDRIPRATTEPGSSFHPPQTLEGVRCSAITYPISQHDKEPQRASSPPKKPPLHLPQQAAAVTARPVRQQARAPRPAPREEGQPPLTAGPQPRRSPDYDKRSSGRCSLDSSLFRVKDELV